MTFNRTKLPIVLALLLFAACTSATDPAATNSNGTSGGDPGDGPFIITDRTGKQWDVTHAVKEYQFRVENFQFGLGPNAIPPIESPRFFSPGEPGWPDINQAFIVIGTTLHGDSRAYPTTILKSFEVVDEQFGDTYVAVGY